MSGALICVLAKVVGCEAAIGEAARNAPPLADLFAQQFADQELDRLSMTVAPSMVTALAVEADIAPNREQAGASPVPPQPPEGPADAGPAGGPAEAAHLAAPAGSSRFWRQGRAASDGTRDSPAQVTEPDTRRHLRPQ